jgi:hypothetical protein
VTAADGSVSASFTLLARGVFTVSARYSSTDSCLEGSNSNAASFTVYQSVELLINGATVTCGEAVTIQALLREVGTNTPVEGQSVSFVFGAGLSGQTAVTDAAGIASVVVTFPSPADYTVTASFSNSKCDSMRSVHWYVFESLIEYLRVWSALCCSR